MIVTGSAHPIKDSPRWSSLSHTQGLAPSGPSLKRCQEATFLFNEVNEFTKVDYTDLRGDVKGYISACFCLTYLFDFHGIIRTLINYIEI